MKTVDIGEEFSRSLTNRDHQQRDGVNSGYDFRMTYLADLDNKEKWQNDDQFIVLDFSNVKRLGPSWANAILKKITLKNISTVKQAIIDQEIETGYSKG